MSGEKPTLPLGRGPEDVCSGRTSELRLSTKRPTARGDVASRWTVAAVDDWTRDWIWGGEVAMVAAPAIAPTR
jgi:hypothetical protein